MSQGILAKIFGGYTSRWYRLGLVPSANDRLSLYAENLALAAGNNNLSIATVPAGEVWFLNFVGVRYTGTVPTNVQLIATINAINIQLVLQNAPASNQLYVANPFTFMVAGDVLLASVAGATANDDLRGYGTGYKLLLTG